MRSKQLFWDLLLLSFSNYFAKIREHSQVYILTMLLRGDYASRHPPRDHIRFLRTVFRPRKLCSDQENCVHVCLGQLLTSGSNHKSHP